MHQERSFILAKLINVPFRRANFCSGGRATGAAMSAKTLPSVAAGAHCPNTCRASEISCCGSQ